MKKINSTSRTQLLHSVQSHAQSLQGYGFIVASLEHFPWKEVEAFQKYLNCWLTIIVFFFVVFFVIIQKDIFVGQNVRGESTVTKHFQLLRHLICYNKKGEGYCWRIYTKEFSVGCYCKPTGVHINTVTALIFQLTHLWPCWAFILPVGLSWQATFHTLPAELCTTLLPPHHTSSCHSSCVLRVQMVIGFKSAFESNTHLTASVVFVS